MMPEKIARSGQPLPALMAALAALPYHALPCPKALGNEWVRNELWPVVEHFPAPVQDKLHTFCLFVATEIRRVLVATAQQAARPSGPLQVLVTGGGTHNHFLLDCLNTHIHGLQSATSKADDERYPLSFKAAEAQTADLKEAALVALCALHRVLGVPNALASATGARFDTCNGALYLPPPA
ncbi:MAG: hypothetical protein HC821_05225 [Lewinella sp.]|nr:hypothetical protein [Lewinella sp.]